MNINCSCSCKAVRGMVAVKPPLAVTVGLIVTVDMLRFRIRSRLGDGGGS